MIKKTIKRFSVSKPKSGENKSRIKAKSGSKLNKALAKAKTEATKARTQEEKDRSAKSLKTLKKVSKKADRLKTKLHDSGLDVEALILAADSGNLGLSFGKSTKSKTRVKKMESEEDYRVEYLAQYTNLEKIEVMLLDDYNNNQGSRAVYALLQVYNQKNAIIEALWSLKKPEDKVSAIEKRVLEPAFRRMTATITDFAQEIRRMVNKELKEKEANRIDQRILSIIRDHSKSLQTNYDQSLDQLAVVAEEDL